MKLCVRVRGCGSACLGRRWCFCFGEEAPSLFVLAASPSARAIEGELAPVGETIGEPASLPPLEVALKGAGKMEIVERRRASLLVVGSARPS